jgi:penicillin G amidase
MKDFEVRTETIKVAGQTPVEYKVYRSIYGPVVHKDNTVAYSQKRAHWGQEINAMVGFYDFNRASNIKQFEEAAQKIPTSHNFLYSDKQGNIGYWITGQNANRAEGTDHRLPMIGDGSQDWKGIHSFETMPQAINPAQGYVANWNNKPSPDWEITETAYGPTHRSKFIIDQLNSMKKVSWSDMEELNKKAGHIDLNAYSFKTLYC